MNKYRFEATCEELRSLLSDVKRPKIDGLSIRSLYTNLRFNYNDKEFIDLVEAAQFGVHDKLPPEEQKFVPPHVEVSNIDEGFVCFVNNKPIAYLYSLSTPIEIKDEETGELDYYASCILVEVLPEWRRKGLVKFMLKKLMESTYYKDETDKLVLWFCAENNEVSKMTAISCGFRFKEISSFKDPQN